MVKIPEINLRPSYLEKLKSALEDTLPGNDAHLNMASLKRLEELENNHPISTAIKSSILILLYPKNNKVFTTFILRQKYDGVHSGQVSFPGGRLEKGDRSLIATALREAKEEVNINPDEVSVLGTLSDLYIPPSNYVVSPVVAYSYSEPDFVAQESEVAEIIESDLGFLFDPKCKKETTIDIGNSTKIKTPYFDVKGHVVWGATAMILSELIEVIKSIS